MKVKSNQFLWSNQVNKKQYSYFSEHMNNGNVQMQIGITNEQW